MESESAASATHWPATCVSRARCSLPEAICLLAREPLEPPEDPYAAEGGPEGLSRMETSRWLLTFLPALRALADHKGRGEPSAPEDWLALEPRLGFRSPRSLWDFDLDEIWGTRLDAMRGHCAASGLKPAVWAARWAAYEPVALAHFEACERRNENLLRAGEALLDAVMRADGPMVCGREVRTGAFAVIPRDRLYDPHVQWEFEPAPLLYENRIAHTGRLNTPEGDYDDVSFAAADIAALLDEARLPRQRPGAWTGKRTKMEAARSAALIEFPTGPPPGMGALRRNDLIRARLQEMCGEGASDRTIRAAVSGLWPIG